MPITNADIYPLARWLHALIPPDERDRLADLCLEVLHDPFEGTEDDHENTEMIGHTTERTPTAGRPQACARTEAPVPL